MCGEKFANEYVELLNIINAITKQKVTELLSDFCFVLPYFSLIFFYYILSHNVT